MAQETLRLIPSGDLTRTQKPYVIDFGPVQRRRAGIRYRHGSHAFHGPVALKIAENPQVTGVNLRRERDVSIFLGDRGGELISKCLAYEFDDRSAVILVAHRGRPLAEMARDQANWPPADRVRRKMVTDLLQALELLQLSGVVHGAIDLYTLYWDGTTLQLVDFGTAALRGTFPDGSTAHFGVDIAAAGRVIYEINTGVAPPGDPAALRRQLEDVTDAEVTDLLLHRDLVTRRDVDYVFAADPEARPTARVLLDRLDRRPHGVQWEQLAAREARVRSDFRELRRRQREFRAGYERWLSPWRPTPAPGSVPRQRDDQATVDLGAAGAAAFGNVTNSAPRGGGSAPYGNVNNAPPYGPPGGPPPYGGARGATPHEGGSAPYGSPGGHAHGSFSYGGGPGSSPYGNGDNAPPYAGTGGPTPFANVNGAAPSPGAGGSAPYGTAGSGPPYRGGDGSLPYGSGAGPTGYDPPPFPPPLRKPRTGRMVRVGIGALLAVVALTLLLALIGLLT